MEGPRLQKGGTDMEMTNGNSCPGEDMNLADPRLEVQTLAESV